MLSKHDGGKSYKDDLRSLYSLVYKVYEKGKETYKSIPVNSALTKFGSNNNDLLDENNYNSQNLLLYKNDFTKPIPTGCKPIIAIKKGVILKKKTMKSKMILQKQKKMEGIFLFLESQRNVAKI